MLCWQPSYHEGRRHSRSCRAGRGSDSEQLNNLDEDFQAKMKNLEKNLNDNLDEAEKGLAQKVTKNIDTLNKKTKLQRDAVVDWSHARANYQENILATRLTICAQDYGHFDKG